MVLLSMKRWCRRPRSVRRIANSSRNLYCCAVPAGTAHASPPATTFPLCSPSRTCFSFLRRGRKSVRSTARGCGQLAAANGRGGACAYRVPRSMGCLGHSACRTAFGKQRLGPMVLRTGGNLVTIVGATAGQYNRRHHTSQNQRRSGTPRRGTGHAEPSRRYPHAAKWRRGNAERSLSVPPAPISGR